MGISQNKKICVSIADVWLDEDDIVRMDFKRTDSHGLKDAKELTAAHAALSNNERRPVLADMRDITIGADKEARNYYASEESSQLKTALAMVTNSKSQRTFGSIYLFLTRPPYPTRIFNSHTEALTWLGTFTHKK